MTSVIDVFALSKKVEHDSKSGKLSRELLAQGQTLYGKNPDYPDYLERKTPDGKVSLGKWNKGAFDEIISLLC
ncbi:hypothetical protein FX988_00174 [Paraglaciecola mesophila]|uniref:Uncharacterized protein n=1 Tax=Paraglaciecola mesophila TaxID=197222 RepID=A0A857JD59_9ALTE|nr:hypothetical protein [Paraglaciecola mesophila]QHJ09965.1 hypothetical protein FX988_00174 [Paraglaciecola mesophila]